MPGAGVVFFWSIIALYALFGVGFALLVPRAEIRRPALAAMAACFCSAVAMPIEVFKLIAPGAMYPMSSALHFLAISFFGAAALYRRGLAVPWRFLLGMAALGCLLVFWFSAIDNDPVPRRLAIASVALILTGGLVSLLFSLRGAAVDRMVTFFLGFSCLNYTTRLVGYLLVLAGSLRLEQAAALTLANYAGLVISAAGLSVSLLVGLCMDIVRDRERRLLVDGLTGLSNRAAFDREMTAMAGMRFGLLIADIDHFKAINDSMGHAAGDVVLAATGKTLRQVADGRFVARIGGEEFIMIEPGAGAVEMRTLAEAVRDVGRRISSDDQPATQAVTFSVGWALCRAGENPREALHKADKALYAAKAGGRDRVMGAPERLQAAQ